VVLAAIPLCAAQKFTTTLNAKQVRALVTQLDDDEFDVREKAEKKLRRAGEAVIPLLKRELARKHPPEARRRLLIILDDLTRNALIARVHALVPQLAAADFDQREAATAALKRISKDALPLLRKALKKTRDLEQRRRLQVVIRHLAGQR
jgi:hypothetical protein